MAKITIVSCDKCSGKDAESVQVVIGTTRFMVDLDEKCLAELQKAVQPFAEAGTELAAVGQRQAPEDRGFTPADVRKWASESGVELSAKGRIPEPIIQQYLQAQGKGE